MTESDVQASRHPRALLLLLSLVAGALVLLPPTIVGTGESALTMQALQRWLSGAPDLFAVQHVGWMWAPYLLGRMTGDAFAALQIFKFIFAASTFFFLASSLARKLPSRWSLVGASFLSLNVTYLYLSHTFSIAIVAAWFAAAVLYFMTDRKQSSLVVAALLVGLSVSVSFATFSLLLGQAIFVHELNPGITGKKSLRLAFFYCLAAITAWLLLQIFLNGYQSMALWRFLIVDAPPDISARVLCILSAIVAANFLLWIPGGKGANTKSRGWVLIALSILYMGQPSLAVAELPLLIYLSVIRQLKLARFASLYLATNVLLFLLLPSWGNDPQIWLPAARRSEQSPTMNVAYYASRSTSGLQTLIEKDQAQNELLTLFGKTNADSALYLMDGTSNYWFDDATVGALRPGARVGFYYGRPINRLRMSGTRDSEFIKPALSTPHLIAIFDKNYAHALVDSAVTDVAPVETEHLQMLDLRTEPDRKAFIDRMIYLHYQSVH